MLDVIVWISFWSETKGLTSCPHPLLLWKPNCWMAQKDRRVPKSRFISVAGWEAPLLQTLTAGTHVTDHTLLITVRRSTRDLFGESLRGPYIERAEGMWLENYLINWQTSVAGLSLVIKSSPSPPPFHYWLPLPLFPCHSVRFKWIFSKLADALLHKVSVCGASQTITDGTGSYRRAFDAEV